jgi:type II secretory pathway component GspD/PulD (secretin)
VEVEVSSPTGSDIGIDPNETGVTISKSTVKTNVVIGDGQTGIIGGLISDQLTRSRSQVPVLGDLPVIGFLFRSRNNTRAKQNLVALLTPHIVKRSADLERLTRQRMDDYYNANVDAIFEKGFVKRIKGKRQQRTEGPVTRAEQSGEFTSNFNRGRLDDN